MSRIGKKPITIPDGVTVNISPEGQIDVKGPKGALQYTAHPLTNVVQEENELIVKIENADNVQERTLWGTTRSNIANLIEGVTEGFSKQLEVVGVGYKVAKKGNAVVFNVGYSHPVEFALPEGVDADVEKNSVTIKGIDKALVGEVAANMRKIRKPEPYKGKGIRYSDEVVRRKVGKAAGKAE